MKITYLNPEKANWFLVTWDISNKCNYRCSYCPDFLHDGSSGWPDFEKVTRFVDTLNEQYPDKKICFRFSGGEPTYWKRFDELGKYIKVKGNYFSFLTNGSQTVEYFQNIKDHTDGVIISYHSEFAETQHIIDVANTLSLGILLLLIARSISIGSLVSVDACACVIIHKIYSKAIVILFFGMANNIAKIIQLMNVFLCNKFFKNPVGFAKCNTHLIEKRFIGLRAIFFKLACHPN